MFAFFTDFWTINLVQLEVLKLGWQMSSSQWVECWRSKKFKTLLIYSFDRFLLHALDSPTCLGQKFQERCTVFKVAANWCFNCDVRLPCSWVVETGEAVLMLDLEYQPRTLAFKMKTSILYPPRNATCVLVVNRIPCSMSLCFRAQVVVASRGLLIRSAMFSCAYRSHTLPKTTQYNTTHLLCLQSSAQRKAA